MTERNFKITEKEMNHLVSLWYFLEDLFPAKEPEKKVFFQSINIDYLREYFCMLTDIVCEHDKE